MYMHIDLSKLNMYTAPYLLVEHCLELFSNALQVINILHPFL